MDVRVVKRFVSQSGSVTEPRRRNKSRYCLCVFQFRADLRRRSTITWQERTVSTVCVKCIEVVFFQFDVGRVNWRMVQSLPREAVSRWDWGEAGAANTKRVNLQPGNEHWWPSSHAIFCLLALLFCRRQATTYCCRARVARKREPANFERGARSSFMDASP